MGYTKTRLFLLIKNSARVVQNLNCLELYLIFVFPKKKYSRIWYDEYNIAVDKFSSIVEYIHDLGKITMNILKFL